MRDTYADWQLSQLSPKQLGLEASYDYSHRQPENEEGWEAEETVRRDAAPLCAALVAALSRMLRQAIVSEISDQILRPCRLKDDGVLAIVIAFAMSQYKLFSFLVGKSTPG